MSDASGKFQPDITSRVQFSAGQKLTHAHLGSWRMLDPPYARTWGSRIQVHHVSVEGPLKRCPNAVGPAPSRQIRVDSRLNKQSTESRPDYKSSWSSHSANHSRCGC